MKPLQTIVIGTSLTPASDRVVQAGAALARSTGATPWLVHSYLPNLSLAFPSGGLDARWIEEQVKSLQEQIAAQARRTGLAALPGFSPETCRLVAGAPQREIAQLAHQLHADLLVVGAAEGDHGFLGSTADRLIRKAPCPVLAVRHPAAFPPTRVEVPVDLSPVAGNALRQGLELLAQIGSPESRTEVLFVLNPFEVGGSIHFSQEQVERFAGEELERFVEQAVADLPAEMRPVRTKVRTGYAREEILAALAERQADLAVLGTHGLGGFDRLMIGSVAAGVLRRAECNLLVVPPDAAGRETSTQASKTLDREGSRADWSYVLDALPAAH